MAIYLGEEGHIELRRRSVNETLSFILSPADVDTAAHRFSFNGIDDEGLLLNGDRVEFLRTDGGNIQLIDGITEVEGVTRYVHVDAVGGIRLYETFSAAINGGLDTSLDLIEPTEDQPIQVSIQDIQYRCLAQVTSYEVTSQRETVDLTLLGDEFRRNYGSGLISGQGQCTAFWDTSTDDQSESVHYLIQLVQRLEMGAMFDARFFIKNAGGASISDGCSDDNDRRAVWWEVSCVVTNTSIAFEPTQVLSASIQFVTSGPFQLKTGTPPGLVLQEDTGAILEDSTGDTISQDTAD